MHVADAPRNQRLVGQLANADGAIDVLRHIIDRPVRYAKIDLDIGITLMKLDQRRNDDEIGDRARHFHAQATFGQGLGARQAAVKFRKIGQQSCSALIVKCAIRCYENTAGRTIEEFCTKMGFQSLDKIADRCLGHIERGGSAREVPGFNNPEKSAHGRELVHYQKAVIVRDSGQCNQL